MKLNNFLAFILILVFANVSFGQTDEDIQVPPEKIEDLYPTMIKYNSSLNAQSKLAGYTLIAISPSPCSGEPTGELYKATITSKTFEKNILNIELAITANCCASFLGEIQIINDTTLNIIYTEYGEACFCNCCFQLTYKIATTNNEITSFQLNGKPIF